MGPPENSMKLLRVGSLKQEKPAILDKFGIVRDISSVISDLNSENINQKTIDLINKTDTHFDKILANCDDLQENLPALMQKSTQ